MPTVPVSRSKGSTTACFSKNRRKADQASTIAIARLLPPLKRRARKRLDKVVEGEVGQGSKERRASGKFLEENRMRRGLEDTIRRGRSRERFDLKEKTESEKLTKKGFAETEGGSQDQPSRESLVALVEHNQVFDEVATRRELHFLIRSLIRSLSNSLRSLLFLLAMFQMLRC